MLAILTTKTGKSLFRSSHPEVILRKGVPKKCSKFTGEHPKLQSNFIEIALPHECYLSYLIAIYVFQVKSSFFEKPKLHPFFVLKQSFGIFSFL